MKKLLSAALASLMLMGSAVTVLADDSAGLALAESSRLKLDTDSGYVDMIDGTITVGDLKANFAFAVTVTGKDGSAKADDAVVATDDIVAAGEDSLKALIYGDADRNGKINVTDASAILKAIAKWEVDISDAAADVDKTASVSIADVSKLLKKLAGWDDISLGNVRWVFENTKLKAENESADLDLYFESPLVKVGRSNTANTGENAYKLKLARNETESCQFFVSSVKDMEGLTVELTPFEHEYGEDTLAGEMFIHYYYQMEVGEKVLYEGSVNDLVNDYYPEPLLPLADSFEAKAGQSQGFTVNVTTPTDAPAGMYKAVLTVRDADGNELKCANIYTYVWDFALPDTPYSKSAFGMRSYFIYEALKMYDGDDHKTHAEYYEFMLDHNLSSYQLPYPITDERADAYMSDPRVTTFEIGGDNKLYPDQDEPEFIKQNFEKVQSNPVWKEKAYFYYVDEPLFEEGAAKVKSQREYLVNLLGTNDFDIILPFSNSMADLNNNIDMLAFIEPYVDIYVPGTVAFMPNIEGDHYDELLWTPRQAYSKYGESLPRLQAIGENPEKELWWYTCIGPTFPWPNLFVNYHGLMTRVIWWQQFMYDVDGFLYWATQNDWADLSKFTTTFPSNGDGGLLYYGEMYGRTGPVASWRLIQIRDGFDDFDYFRMAEELVGREEVLKLVNKLTTNVTTVNEDNDLMEDLRDQVAKIILENQAK